MQTFLAQHQIFTIEEVRKALHFDGQTSTLYNLLAYHVERGHIFRIRQGLYYTVPRGSNAETYPADSYLVAAKMTDDAVLAYHTALDYHGHLHTMRNDRVYLTRKKSPKPFIFQNVAYKGIAIPKKITASRDPNFGILTIDRAGIKIRITCLERTFVDILDRPTLVGEWEEIVHSLESINYFDLEKIVEYTRLLGNAITCARVAFFLEMNKEQWHVSEELLKVFESYIPKKPYYLNYRSNEPQRLISRWNLIIPHSFLKRTWEEPHGDF